MFSKYNHIINYRGKKILFNTMSLAIAEIDELTEKYLAGTMKLIDKKTYSNLLENGFIYDNDFSENAELKAYYWSGVSNF